MTGHRPLVIAYGNRLRGDDAVGWVVADALRDDVRMESVDVLAVHQLTPDLANEMTSASRVVFVDARLDSGLAPGVVAVDTVLSEFDAGSMTHNVGAGTIMSLADALYGAHPPALAVTVAIKSVEPGADLSSAVSASVSELVETVIRLCAETSDA
ncbi:MAG TPA: hydrogenase maturation protease [Acidothermaceae bacterium]|nr:hydrogenase maturation protease [Acidothermaceae bacterium]